ncbi:hypothetical protein PRZ48_014857 [Zasmidium cellare]|uniref:RNA helicase n=1 Tax=Zasmidium cellare TaxID=395010 RepID=A0ABR0DX03_ZASCE|nr:hypothetical protein PRZ48_014857 [Zasmidium cellare]
MSLLGIPAALRLQIWNRHLALRGRTNICHGNALPALRAPGYANCLWRRHYASVEKVSERRSEDGDSTPPQGLALKDAMMANRSSTVLPENKSQAISNPSAKLQDSKDKKGPQSTNKKSMRDRRAARRRPTTENALQPKTNVVPKAQQEASPIEEQHGVEQAPASAVQYKPESYPKGANPNDGPFDVQYMQTHLEMPTNAQYPHADVNLLNPRAMIRALRKACKHHLGVEVDLLHLSSHRVDQGNHDIFVCERTLAIPSLTTISVIGEGRSNADATSAASLHLLSKLHTDGILKRLASAAPAVPSENVEADEAFHSAMSSLKDDYKHIVPSLFSPTAIASTIYEAFQRARIPWNVEAQTSVGKAGVVYCTLRVQLPDDVEATTKGLGQNKHFAKSVAWANMSKKFQKSGTLQALFPVRDQVDAQASTEMPEEEPEEIPDDEVADLEDLVTVDSKTMQAEKDAKVEIYNWAARLGLTPEYQARIVKKREPGKRKQSKAKYLDLAEVTIELKDLGLKTIRLGRTLRIAETAAAMAFKSAAEEKENAGLIKVAAADNNQWALLNFDTARQFFDFYRGVRKDVYLEVDAQPFAIAGETHNWAHVTLNDQTVGRWVMMNRKPTAEQLARLTAAVEIVKAEPQLLGQFEAFVRTGKGSLREMRSIKTSIDNRTVELMRNGVVEARHGGLSDVRQSLHPVENLPEDYSNRQRRRLSHHDRRTFSKARLTELRRRHGDPLQHQDNDKTALPMSQYRSRVLKLVGDSPYSIIVGATGSGKTTQVPQILLDDAIWRGEGGFCDVICTQPRRLAATSIANRVANERNESLGKSIGYHVRFDYKPPRPGGSITYCTTGILLEQLKHDTDGIFDTVSHIVIDEVHERSLPIDFLMVLLKRAIKKRSDAGKPVPKVILMSATLDQDLFAKYFAEDHKGSLTPAPVLTVPGRTFPVREKYLENVLADFSPNERADLDAMAEIDKGKTSDYLESELSFAKSKQRVEAPVIDWKREVKVEQSEEDSAAARERDEARVPLALVAATIAHICRRTEDGAVLVFLPGLPEIVAVRDMLADNPASDMAFDDANRFKICLLHSALPPHEQNDVIEPVGKGCRKIILSTNIAETSVTVPDVKYVVDSGKLRQKRYDQARRITQLVTTWESSSNARQRAGRAGRVQPGDYYALFTRHRREAMPASAPPELHLSDLQETCLSIQAQGLGDSVQSFLGQTIEPPSAPAVLGAIEALKEIEALTQDESLTALGKTLSRLPVHPSLGKMILLGIIFRCLDPMIVLSSLDQDRSLFVSPLPGNRVAARQAQGKYNQHDSDQLAFYEAFKELRTMQSQSSMHNVEQHARQNFLHWRSFKSALANAVSIEQILIESRLVPRSASVIREQSQYGGTALNRHSDNPALIKALFLAGVHPNLAARNAGRSIFYRTHSEGNIMIHPSSLNYTAKKSLSSEEKLHAYESLRKTVDGKAMYMKDTTLVTPLLALLFGGKLHAEGFKLTMDAWLPFKIENLDDSAFATRLVLEFRKALDRMLNGAFNSLSEVKEGITIADDPIRDGFVKATVAVLEWSGQLMKREERRKRDSGIWVPEEWKQGQNQVVRKFVTG